MYNVKHGWSKVACVAFVLCAALPLAGAAQTFTSMVSFDGAKGANPQFVSLVQGMDGNLYGTTMNGGTRNAGALFRMTPTGKLTTLYSFCSLAYCVDGSHPNSGLVLGADGNLYGTTTTDFNTPAYGTVFRITPGGALTTLHTFCAQPNCADGGYPVAALALGADGNFYGTTTVGGDYGYGTVFKMTPDGTLTVLDSLDLTVGVTVWGPLIQGPDGDLYGTAIDGGTHNGGTVFKITPSGTPTLLYSFCSQAGCADGAGPFAGLVLGRDGDFYGTTYWGGDYDAGTIFKITPAGTLTTLHSFCAQSGCADGFNPTAGLAPGTDGNFYGAAGGGTTGGGMVFKMTPQGTLSTLYSFGGVDGAAPYGGLFQATNGILYGTTSIGGTSDSCGPYGCGTIFSLNMGLGPFVETLPTSGRVGQRVMILGTDLTGATSVTFNGRPATFTVVSGSLIRTMVPAGATTGTVRVTFNGASKVLTSNVVFRVK
jgi:uncharacterized repeat protein (TIGR03803 family)